jgi:hypothetical protein
MSTDKLRLALTQRGSNNFNSYNDVNGFLEFPAWEGMVREYVSTLARNQLI